MPDGVNEWGKIVPLREIALPSKSMCVDKEQAVIHGVRILGPASLNGRRYTPEAIEKAASLYEDRPVNVDHPDHNAGGQRRVADRFGWLKNVTYRNAGLEGELHYLKSHPQATAVVEAAERNPALFGLSHNADGRMAKRGKEYLVEEIVGVRSVDLVADPATTKSLFESLQLKENEMDGVDSIAADPVATGTGTFDMLSAKLREIWDGDGDASTKAGEMNKIIRALLKLEDTLSGEAAKPDKPAEDAPAAESAIVKQLAAGLTALTEKLDNLQKAVENPTQRPRSTPLVEGKRDDSFKPPANAKEFAYRLVNR